MTTAGQEGGCRCGDVRFSVTGAPLLVAACHCTGCQRMTASAFSVSSLYPKDQFAVRGGETVRGGVGSGPFHHMCPRCMSWLFTVPEGMDDYVNVRSTMLDDPARHRPYANLFRGEGVPWANTDAPVTFEGMPAQDAFPKIAHDYAAWEHRVAG